MVRQLSSASILHSLHHVHQSAMHCVVKQFWAAGRAVVRSIYNSSVGRCDTRRISRFGGSAPAGLVGSFGIAVPQVTDH